MRLRALGPGQFFGALGSGVASPAQEQDDQGIQVQKEHHEEEYDPATGSVIGADVVGPRGA